MGLTADVAAGMTVRVLGSHRGPVFALGGEAGIVGSAALAMNVLDAGSNTITGGSGSEVTGADVTLFLPVAWLAPREAASPAAPANHEPCLCV